MPSSHEVDSLLLPRWLIPVEPNCQPLDNHALVINEGRIVAVEPADEARVNYSPHETIELPDHALMPGLINAHTHSGMNMMRGLADDLPLMAWLQEHIWPAEDELLSSEFTNHAAESAIAEMLRSGTTCFNDMYFFPDAVADVAARAGMRASLGMILVDVPTAWAQDAAEYIEKGRRVHDEWRHHPLISTMFAPHAPYTVSDEPLNKIRVLADEMDMRIHMHVHETAGEVEDALAQTGQRPLARLQELGLLNPNLLAVHMTAITDDEIAAVANAGAHVIHSPESNHKLASGMCPVADLLDAGVNVALGTDSVASNNDLDMIGEMRTAAMAGKLTAGDPSALSAETVLRMATINGARALGLEDETGSLEPGKSADCIAIDLNTPETRPVYDPVAQIVYSSDRRQVSDAWVAGRRLLNKRDLTTIDLDTVMARGDEWQQRLMPHRRLGAHE